MSPRIKAFLIHSGLSSVIAAMALCIVLFVWYPAPLAKATGVAELFLMLLAIDVILGSLFTLLVYKQGKKSLKFDLSIIILLQISAFIFGFYHIAQGRPAWIVLNGDSFELIRANDILQASADHAMPEFQHSSWLGPQYVALPSIYGQRKSRSLFEKVSGGLSTAQYPHNYIQLKQASSTIKTKAQEVSSLNSYNEKSKVDKVLSKYLKSSLWMPLQARSLDMVVLLNDNGEVIKIVDLRPWH